MVKEISSEVRSFPNRDLSMTNPRVLDTLDKLDQLGAQKLDLIHQLNTLCGVHSARINRSAEDFGIRFIICIIIYEYTIHTNH